MAHAIRMHEAGGPEVLRCEEVAVGNPGPGQARLRHVAVGLNFADTYFRTGPLSGAAAERHGRRGGRRGRGGRRRRDQRRARRPRDLHGLPQHARRVQHRAAHPGGAADQAAAGDLVRDRGRDDDARTDVGVPDAPHLAAARGRHDPAARRRGRRRADRVAVGEAAGPQRHRHGVDRGEGGGRARPRLRPRDQLRAARTSRSACAS